MESSSRIRSLLKNFQDSASFFRFWWTPLGAIGVLVGFSLTWFGDPKYDTWPVSGWAIAQGPWGYDSLNFHRSIPELFLTLWLVPLTAVLLLGIGLARMAVRSLYWVRIWAWICICVSLVVLAILASQGHSLNFPFWGTATSLVIAGLGLFVAPGWQDTGPDRRLYLAATAPVTQKHLSRRGVLFNLAGMAGLAATGGSLAFWLVERSSRAHASRVAYLLTNNPNIPAMYSSVFSWSSQNTLLMAQYKKETDRSNLSIWEIAPKTRKIDTFGSEEFYDDVAFSPDGRSAVSSSISSSSSRIWNVQTGTSVATGFVSGLIAWSPDSSRLAGIGEGGLVIWDVARNHQFAQYRLAKDTDEQLYQIAWSPNGQWLATREGPNNLTTLRLYEVQTGKNVLNRTFKQINPWMYRDLEHLAWSPDSRYLALPFTTSSLFDANRDQNFSLAYPVVIWDVAAQKAVLSYTGHQGGANYVAWSPDGTYLASGGYYDATVQIWIAMTGEQVFMFNGHQYKITYIGWSPDGKLIASTDGWQVLTWDAPIR